MFSRLGKVVLAGSTVSIDGHRNSAEVERPEEKKKYKHQASNVIKAYSKDEKSNVNLNETTHSNDNFYRTKQPNSSIKDNTKLTGANGKDLPTKLSPNVDGLGSNVKEYGAAAKNKPSTDVENPTSIPKASDSKDEESATNVLKSSHLPQIEALYSAKNPLAIIGMGLTSAAVLGMLPNNFFGMDPHRYRKYGQYAVLAATAAIAYSFYGKKNSKT